MLRLGQEVVVQLDDVNQAVDEPVSKRRQYGFAGAG